MSDAIPYELSEALDEFRGVVPDIVGREIGSDRAVAIDEAAE
jgi:hypothetical protein